MSVKTASISQAPRFSFHLPTLCHQKGAERSICGARLPRFESRLLNLLALGPGGSHFTFLNLSSFISKAETPLLQGSHEVKESGKTVSLAGWTRTLSEVVDSLDQLDAEGGEN